MFCDFQKTYINRAFVCEFNCNFSDFNIFNYKTYCLETNLSKFHCKSVDKAISFFQVCNYINDCEDGSDENICGT